MGQVRRIDSNMTDVLLNVENLTTSFPRDWTGTEVGSRSGWSGLAPSRGLLARAVDGLSFQVGEGETLALVGESGCGKTVTALSILRLVPPPGRVTAGRIVFEGRNLLDLDEREMRRVRGARIAMVFQDPGGALNPVLRVGAQIAEVLRAHRSLSRREARRRAVEILERVAVPSPEVRVDAYPHQLSTGMKQRAVLAAALAGEPRLLVADEPTTALDVTVQAQVIDLLRNIQRQTGMSILFITHDLGVVAEIADRVVVMYAGRAVEEGPVSAVFERPRHPYTVGLFRSLPGRQVSPGAVKGVPLEAIPGSVPQPDAFPPGCRFHPRCALAEPACGEKVPEPVSVGEDHRSACLRLKDGELPPWPASKRGRP